MRRRWRAVQLLDIKPYVILTTPRAHGGWRFSRPAGRQFDAIRSEPAASCEWTALQSTHAASGLKIDADTAACRWRGERMDIGLAVSLLCGQAPTTLGRCGQAVSAET